jgi:hypothetical protein
VAPSGVTAWTQVGAQEFERGFIRAETIAY